MSIFRKKPSSLLVDIRRADYLASITHSIGEAKAHIEECKASRKQAEDLIAYCKENGLRKFKRVAKMELRLILDEQKFYEKQQEALLRLYGKAYNNAPGSR